MALVVFGSNDSRRAQVAVMRLVATALETRPFDGDYAELVVMFSNLLGCSGCHGFHEPPDFSDLLGPTLPMESFDETIAMIDALLVDDESRNAAVNAGLLVAMFAENPDLEGLLAARRIAQSLGCDESLIDEIVAVANATAASAKADLFRRFLSNRIDVDSEIVGQQMERHDLAGLTRPDDIERFHRLVAEASPGSLGAEMRRFYDDASFDIPGTPGVLLPIEFLASHDIHHVLAGYDTSAQGEAYTAVFNAGNASTGMEWLSVVLLQWHQGIRVGVFPEGHSHLDPVVMATAAVRGSQTTTDIYDANWDWMSALDRPLNEARESLGIPDGGQVPDGGSWHIKPA